MMNEITAAVAAGAMLAGVLILSRRKTGGGRAGQADDDIVRGGIYASQGCLMTPREQQFLCRLEAVVDARVWRICPQVRLADVVQVRPQFRARSRRWWRYFSVISQWHCDVVIVRRSDFHIAAVIELDDASHLQARRVRRDALFGAVLAQSGIRLLRGRDAGALLRDVSAHLNDPEVLNDEKAA